MWLAWGRNEWKRVSGSTLAELDDATQAGLRSALSEPIYLEFQDKPLISLPLDKKSLAVSELGRRALTELYRQLLLSVITELWVDYLTQMEALRVSIGLEAYAQRDPLVQYKSKASELFQDLFRNMRLGVITRMFTFRPRDLASMQVAARRAKEIEAQDQPVGELPEAEAAPEGVEIEAASEDGQEVDGQEPVSALQETGKASKVGKSKKMSKSQKRRRGRK
jgi:preprotein translocase subunit SecA